MAGSKAQINVGVANVYREPSYLSDMTTQGLLGESIQILDQQDAFSKIRLPDHYQGWISDQQWVKGINESADSIRVRSHFAQIRKDPDFRAITVRDATIGVRLCSGARQGSWINVILPDGMHGWIHEDATGKFPELSMDALVAQAKEFLGYPYCWGGKSPRGFDCSGLTQTVFSLFGIQLPRDSWMQSEATKLVSNRPEDALTGDLYFFAERGKRVSHVGIALGQRKIIHARGNVRINSLDPEEPDFSADLLKNLVDVRRIPDLKNVM